MGPGDAAGRARAGSNSSWSPNMHAALAASRMGMARPNTHGRPEDTGPFAYCPKSAVVFLALSFLSVSPCLLPFPSSFLSFSCAVSIFLPDLFVCVCSLSLCLSFSRPAKETHRLWTHKERRFAPLSARLTLNISRTTHVERCLPTHVNTSAAMPPTWARQL